MPTSPSNDKPNYTDSEIWDTIWSRPYSNYERHHEFFWGKIREIAHGKVLDIGCGSASCWKGADVELHGTDFSFEAIQQAMVNYPSGSFIHDEFPNSHYNGEDFDCVVMCGIVNYYRDLDGLIRMVRGAVKPGGKVIVTINVVKDFPDREWTAELINETFKTLGMVEAQFFDKIGWFVVVSVA